MSCNNTQGAAPAKGGLSTWKIVFLVVAATTPMAAVVGTVPIAFALGTGPGLPVMFMVCGFVMLCFITAYAAMSREVVNTGALFTYIRAGLGNLMGAGAAYVAVVAYAAFTIGVAGAFGYFGSLILDLPGVPWPAYSALLLVVMWLLGRRQLDLSVWTLGLLMGAEVLIIVVLDIAIAAHKGAHALPTASLDPGVAFGAGLAAAVTFAFTSFIGLESAALYGEEARDPRKTVARAGHWSVVLITVFYTLTSWLAVGGMGADNVRERAGTEAGGLFFSLAAEYATPVLSAVMAILLMTSFVATGVALQNAASRYIFALGRERMLPTWLGRRHQKFGSPARANTALFTVAAVVIGIAGLAGLDPYLNVAASLISLATIGIMVLMLGASLSALVYFSRRPADRHWWRTIAAPAIALVGLAVGAVLVVAHYSYLTGSHSVIINGLPWLVLVSFGAGVTRAAWLGRQSPSKNLDLAPEAAEPAREPASV
jgi:amino acid transporter